MLLEYQSVLEERGYYSANVNILNSMAYMSTVLGDYPRARAAALAIQKLPGRPRTGRTADLIWVR